MVPTPAAARYIAAGDPRPPAPMQSTLAGLQLALTVHADLRHDQMPAVAFDLVVGELWAAHASGRCAGQDVTAFVGAPPATDGMMLTVSPGDTGVCSFCR